MKRVEVFPCGFKVYDDKGNLVGYEGDYNGEGFIYKDEDAFFNHPDELCYIPEHAFPENEEEDFETTPQYAYVPVAKALAIGETHKTIAEQVRDAWGDDYMLDDEQVEYIAKDVFGIAEWACIDTYLSENFELDDCIEFDSIKNGGVFTQFQYEAVVMNGMTPKEYAERSLSYGELVELDREFDEAFIVDEDCEDDWSDKGLGANARLTYIEERRTGVISGPDEFDCDDKWRKSTRS